MYSSPSQSSWSSYSDFRQEIKKSASVFLVYQIPKSSTTKQKMMSRVLCLHKPGVIGQGSKSNVLRCFSIYHGLVFRLVVGHINLFVFQHKGNHCGSNHGGGTIQ